MFAFFVMVTCSVPPVFNSSPFTLIASATTSRVVCKIFPDSVIRVVSSAYPILLIFCLPLMTSSTFSMFLFLLHKLNRTGKGIHTLLTPILIHFYSLYSLSSLTATAYSQCRFIRIFRSFPSISRSLNILKGSSCLTVSKSVLLLTFI